LFCGVSAALLSNGEAANIDPAAKISSASNPQFRAANFPARWFITRLDGRVPAKASEKNYTFFVIPMAKYD
jgi:hypothetical protein